MSPQALPVATVAPQGLSFGIPGGPEPGGAAETLGAITSCWEIRTGSEHLLRPTTFPGAIFPAGMSCFNRKRERWVAAAAPPQMLKVWLIFSSCSQRWLGLSKPGKHKLLTFGHLICFGSAWCNLSLSKLHNNSSIPCCCLWEGEASQRAGHTVASAAKASTVGLSGTKGTKSLSLQHAGLAPCFASLVVFPDPHPKQETSGQEVTEDRPGEWIFIQGNTSMSFLILKKS